jgi:hypothetical protein
MNPSENQRPGQQQAQAGPAAAAQERDSAATAGPPNHARPTTQAERAVMHPMPSVGQGDLHDPDWRYYHATGA